MMDKMDQYYRGQPLISKATPSRMSNLKKDVDYTRDD
jgi:hypothetical protein